MQYIVMVSMATGKADSLHFFGPFSNVETAFHFASFSTAGNAIVMPLRAGLQQNLYDAHDEFKDMG